MRLERSTGTIIHNRRFARRAGAHSHFSYPNPATHAALPKATDRIRQNAVSQVFSPGLPFAVPAIDPLHDAGFVAECAEGILNGLTDPVIGIDRDGRIKTCNAAGAALIGQAVADLAGRAVGDVFCAENAWVAERVGAVRVSCQPERIEGKPPASTAFPAHMISTSLSRSLGLMGVGSVHKADYGHKFDWSAA